MVPFKENSEVVTNYPDPMVSGNFIRSAKMNIETLPPAGVWKISFKRFLFSGSTFLWWRGVVIEYEKYA